MVLQIAQLLHGLWEMFEQSFNVVSSKRESQECRDGGGGAPPCQRKQAPEKENRGEIPCRPGGGKTLRRSARGIAQKVVPGPGGGRLCGAVGWEPGLQPQ